MLIIGQQDIDFDPDMPNDIYLSQNYTEVEVGIVPDMIQMLGSNTQSE